METNIRHLIDFEKVDALLEGFNKSTGFVTAILDLEGNVLSKSGWRQICTEFHRVNPETSKKCTLSDTELANKMGEGEKYHFYKCLNGLVDVAVPIRINGEHVANLFSGQFFFEEPNSSFFKKQAEHYGFDEGKYMAALKNVPVASQEKVKTAMDFLLAMTLLTSDLTLEKAKQFELNKQISEGKAKAEEGEKTLKHSHDLMQYIIEHDRSAIAVHDKNFKYIYVSQRYLDEYKIKEKDIIGKHHYDVFPDLPQKWRDVHKKALAGEVISADDDPYYKDDGTVEWTRWECRPWYEAANSIGGFIVYTEVITERKKVEEELISAKVHAEESEEKIKSQNQEISFNNQRLESLLEISQLQTNSVQELLDFALKHAVDLTKSKIGYIYFYVEEKKQFILNTWSKEVMKECSVMNPQTVYDLEKTGCWGEAVRQRKPIIINNYQAENPIKKGTPEGHVKLEKFLTIPVIFDNKIVAVAGVANKSTNYDSSDIRQLTLLMDNVWKISERLVLIKDLLAAKDHAEESDRLKSAFLANMSHEIRTPMNGILGFAELLKEPDLSGAKQQEYIKIIEKSGNRMLNIINDIVDISKIEAGLIKLDIKESDINEQIEYIYTFFKPEVEAKGMKLSFRNPLSAKEAILKTDREKLYAILTNLVKNAIKYTKEGSIELGYVLKAAGEHAVLEFYVKDTGIGIPKDRQSVIFERFMQADISDKMARQGSGLGLSISKAYIEMLGGNIWVESEPGVGSTFYFTLPYNAAMEERISAENSVSADIGAYSMKKLKILIVEDDEASCQLLSIGVQKFQKELISVQTGNEAIEVCRNNPDIDLVFMDIQLPGINGYETTQQIRTFNPDVVIIAQTAFALSADKEKATEAGCTDYISKPIQKEELMKLMQKYFMNRKE